VRDGNAGSCLSLIVTKPKYPEIDSRESDSAFPPKRLHVSPPSDQNPGAFSFRRARPVAFHNGAVPRSAARAIYGKCAEEVVDNHMEQ